MATTTSRTTTPQARKADTAYEELKRHIVTLRIQPGEPLTVPQLMERFQMGRTPLREAIQRLVRERLAIEIPRRGCYVTELSVLRLNEMIMAREVIEPANARIAARWITADEITRLRSIIDEGTKTVGDDVETGMYIDLEFHREVARASRNRYLAEAVHDINTSMLRYWYISMRAFDRDLPNIFKNHHRIVDLLELHDGPAVEEAMHQHIDVFRQRIQQSIGTDAEIAIG
ncbi:MAG TPA: GntR family transcriptional regulator [Nitrolancea sp.]|nr:GntR family transcriptional regulator [Nitrolancea sp.]